MPKVTARIKIKNKHFEIHVDLDEALKIKAGKGDIASVMDVQKVYSDMKKGHIASNSDLMDAFNTTDVYQIAQQIITKGEVQKTQEFRDQERDNKIKQVISLIIRNAVDQNGRPYTEERIKRAMDEARVIIDNRTAEQQLSSIVDSLKKVIPIKLEVKKIKITIPAQYTGHAYSLLKDYKESEDWLANGSLQAVLNIPAGLQIDFYEKLNSITHGAAQSEEVKEKV